MAPLTVATFTARTRVVCGPGSLGRLTTELEALQASRVALVADRGVADAGLLDPIMAQLGARRAGAPVLVELDPSIADADAAIARARASKSDSVVAVGGGSALGLGKAVAIGLTNDRGLAAYIGTDRAERAPVPCVAIPTTAGSGSEVSPTLVLHDEAFPTVVVVRGVGYEPDVALLDGELLRSLPRRPMMDAALDALSHALESLWARGASSFTEALAHAAAQTICRRLGAAVERRDVDDLQALLEAATLANLACGSSGLALVHALTASSAPQLAHGRMTGVLLPHVARFNADFVSAELVEMVDGLYREVGVSPRFEPGEFPAASVGQVIEAALEDPFLANNRRPAGELDLVAILQLAGATP